jgi:hypothetical protein
METFVIFDPKTGEVLQTHVQDSHLHGDPRELLQEVRPETKPESVDIMRVDYLLPGTGYRVDIKSKKLLSVDKSKAPGSGGAFVQSSEDNPELARRVIFQVKERNS